MISASFRIELPEGLWVTELSRRYPRTTFRLLSGYRFDDHAIELGETITDRPDEVVDAIRTHPSVSNYEPLESEAYETGGTSSISRGPVTISTD